MLRRFNQKVKFVAELRVTIIKSYLGSTGGHLVFAEVVCYPSFVKQEPKINRRNRKTESNADKQSGLNKLLFRN